MNHLICPHCGTENEAEAAVCSHCGQPIVAAAGESAPAAEEAPEEELPDWLDELTEEGAAPVEDQGVDALLDWLDEPESEAVEIEVPDWLEPEEALGLQAKSEEEAAHDATAAMEDAAASDTQADEDEERPSLVPDWLEDVLDEEEAAEIFALQEAEAEGDWLSALDATEREEEAAGMAEDEPEWVKALTQAPAEDSAEDETDQPLDETETPPVTDPGSLPATRPLRRTSELENVPEQIAGTDLPDWLADQLQDEPDEPPEAAPQATETAQPLPDWLAEEGQEAEQAEADDEGELGESAQVPAEADADVEVEAAATVELELAATQADEGEALDEGEWLQMVEELTEAEAAQGDEVEPVTLNLGDLGPPGWLEAGPRPSEEPLPTPMEAPLESSGPLAGLRGVIPIEPIIAERRRASHSEPTPLTERERELAGLLEGLASQTLPVTAEESGAVDGRLAAIFRLLVGLGLLALLVVGWLQPELMPFQAANSGTGPMAAEALAAIDRQAGQTALVVFDYTPAMAGELDVVADLMLARLAAADVRVMWLSQTAAGIRLGQRALERNGVEGLDSLGLLPGEAVGLRWVSGCLAGTPECQSFFGREVDGALQQELDRVGLVVVVTGEQGSLINWIEQVESQTDVAMVAGLTQGLAPVAVPYYANRQLVGLVAGAPDAAAAGASKADELVNSVALAQWAAIALLIVGGVYSGVVGFGRPSSRRGNDS
ncbi:MAG: zinc-ribbon domain-containing protein [Candidatus Promineifilaceae bacterium]|nr:zinc-ribbon domain-containing protein [Candidatus Promineifilaceae bacterium]